MGWRESGMKKTLKFEGVVTHMYLDHRGRVTVGVGYLIDSVGDARRYGFVRRDNRRRATPQEIEADWKTVKASAKAKKASTYKRLTKLELPEAEAKRKFPGIFDEHVRKYAAKFVSNFAALPDACKEALADMAYNLGGKFNKQFVQLRKAIERRDWSRAAKESRRRTSRAERNKYVQDLFLSLAKAATHGSLAHRHGNHSRQGLQRSVGRAGVNRVVDVELVQGLLNEAARESGIAEFKVTENGRCGQKTISAIREFQRTVLGFKRPDRRVDPVGKTCRALRQLQSL